MPSKRPRRAGSVVDDVDVDDSLSQTIYRKLQVLNTSNLKK